MRAGPKAPIAELTADAVAAPSSNMQLLQNRRSPIDKKEDGKRMAVWAVHKSGVSLDL